MYHISVIIPVFNAAKTIDECIQSIINQTIFEDMEVIIVDDRSTDSTVERLIKFEEMYPEQIKIIALEENAGPGNARNVAMEYATGEYIGYVDADDAIVPVMYEHLYEEAKRTDADIVDGGFYDQRNDTAIVFTSDDLTGELDPEKRSRLIVSGGYNTTKVFRRTFLINGNINFRNEYVLEDMDYLIEVFAKAKSISNVKEVLYIYRDSNDSLSKTMEADKYIYSTKEAMEAIYSKTHDLPVYNEIRDACEYAMLQLYSFSINKCLQALLNNDKSPEESIVLLEELKELRAKYVSKGYDNEYVLQKISSENIDIMKCNDISPRKLCAEVLKRDTGCR